MNPLQKEGELNGCGACRYFDKVGTCHYNPPTGEGFPSVEADNWCGKFRRLYLKNTGSGKLGGRPDVGGEDEILEALKAGPLPQHQLARVVQAKIPMHKNTVRAKAERLVADGKLQRDGTLYVLSAPLEVE
jgi:hypothetical protein